MKEGWGLIGAEFVITSLPEGLAVKLNEAGSEYEIFTWDELGNIGIIRANRKESGEGEG